MNYAQIMIRICLIFIFMSVSFIAFSQDEPDQPNRYQLMGEIVSEVAQLPHCGVIAVAMVVEVEILQLSDPLYNYNRIPVIITCPEFHGEHFFEKGEAYSMVLLDQNPAGFEWSIFGWEIYDEYFLDTVYYVETVKKLSL
ncbi:MAG: hypothetical protein HKN36_08935 [Hellea sp.]|nr:hypothetical protein [Hellea sp.]